MGTCKTLCNLTCPTLIHSVTLGFCLDSSVCDEVSNKLKQELDEITPKDYSKNEKDLRKFHYTQLCEKQPIGKRLFDDFCRNAQKKIRDVHDLAQAIRDYEAGTRLTKMHLKQPFSQVISVLTTKLLICFMTGKNMQTRWYKFSRIAKQVFMSHKHSRRFW